MYVIIIILGIVRSQMFLMADPLWSLEAVGMEIKRME
jgi:hypothetical protein